jgi:hypothetical protein
MFHSVVQLALKRLCKGGIEGNMYLIQICISMFSIFS